MKNKLLYIHNNPPTNNKANTIQVANMANALANNFDKPSVLVAGCGTGRHIFKALNYLNKMFNYLN